MSRDLNKFALAFIYWTLGTLAQGCGGTADFGQHFPDPSPSTSGATTPSQKPSSTPSPTSTVSPVATSKPSPSPSPSPLIINITGGSIPIVSSLAGLDSYSSTLNGFAADATSVYVQGYVQFSSLGLTGYGVFKADWATSTWSKICSYGLGGYQGDTLAGLAVDNQNLYFMLNPSSQSLFYSSTYKTVQTVKWSECSNPSTPYQYQTLAEGYDKSYPSDPLNIEGNWVYLRSLKSGPIKAYSINPVGASRTITLQTPRFTAELINSVSVRSGYIWAVSSSYIIKFNMNGVLLAAADLMPLLLAKSESTKRIFALSASRIALQTTRYPTDKYYLLDVSGF